MSENISEYRIDFIGNRVCLSGINYTIWDITREQLELKDEEGNIHYILFSKYVPIKSYLDTLMENMTDSKESKIGETPLTPRGELKSIQYISYNKNDRAYNGYNTNSEVTHRFDSYEYLKLNVLPNLNYVEAKLTNIYFEYFTGARFYARQYRGKYVFVSDSGNVMDFKHLVQLDSTLHYDMNSLDPKDDVQILYSRKDIQSVYDSIFGTGFSKIFYGL